MRSALAFVAALRFVFAFFAVCMEEKKIKRDMIVLAGEFFRYCIVGGIAFLADFAALWLAQEFLFRPLSLSEGVGASLAACVGFVVGLIVNYFLSLEFVFTQEKDAGCGRTFGAFVVFGVVGLVGLGLTALGMWVGVSLAHLHYLIVKIPLTGIVLVWNYLGRKLLVFNAKEKA